jgi:methylmalonyl-CoA mutase cobalamin-binding subunit
VGVLYLGPDVPVASWVHVIARNRTRVAVLTIVQEADRAAALDVAEALRADGKGPMLAAGGNSARWDVALESGIVVLPDRINDAAAVTARLVTGSAVG